MSDLIERLRDRYSKHSQELRDEAADEIERLRKERDVWKANAETNLGEVERLRAVVDAAQRLYSGGLYPENHDYVLISDLSLDALEKALDKLRGER
jgi:hypothetical protein